MMKNTFASHAWLALTAPDRHAIYRSYESIFKLDLGECSALPKDSASLASPSHPVPDQNMTEGVGVIRVCGLTEMPDGSCEANI
jgi:hypothetical protein